jgi:hypothetical protein
MLRQRSVRIDLQPNDLKRLPLDGRKSKSVLPLEDSVSYLKELPHITYAACETRYPEDS